VFCLHMSGPSVWFYEVFLYTSVLGAASLCLGRDRVDLCLEVLDRYSVLRSYYLAVKGDGQNRNGTAFLSITGCCK
jgi:hypothetical protein